MERKIVPDVIGQKQLLLELPGTATVRDAARRMYDREVGAVLITNGGRLEGIFTERDLLMRVVAPGRDPETTQLKDVMTKKPDTVEADSPATVALSRMTERRYRHLPVMKDGQLFGIVSRRDFTGEDISAVEDVFGHEQTL
jgi:CBS domain-containing protein